MKNDDLYGINKNVKNIKKQDNIKSTKNKEKRKKKKRPALRIFLLVLLIGSVSFGIFFADKVNKNGGGMQGILSTVVGHDENTLKDLPNMQFILMGESGVDEDYKLADTIMVCSYNPKTQKASIMSIPRDTYVGKKDKNGSSTTQNYVASYKMNTVYRSGTNIQAAVDAINEITGLDIEHYIIVDTKALIQLVDALGGVTFNVPIDMKYDDPTQNLHIDLKAGEQLLNGEKAEQLLRFRHNNDYTTYPSEYGDNDIGRMRTQREFITEVLNQTLKPQNIFILGQILEIANKNVTTNIDINYAKDYIPYAVNFSTQNLNTGVLPGKPEQCNNGVYIYSYNKKETQELIEELFLEKEKSDDTNTITDNTTNSTTNNITNNLKTTNTSKK